MEKNKKTIVKNITLPLNKRLIFMSDIHGDIKLFRRVLLEIGFCDDDYLFVIGDMIEKGDYLDNLQMLNYIIELNKKENVYFMAGNCDEVLRFILPPVDKSTFLDYALVRKKSIINDLANEFNFPVFENMDVDLFVKKIVDNHPEYYQFIDELPDVIIINDSLVLVHGGIMDINDIPENAIDVLKFDRFLEISEPQPKLMVVGHYPTRNYHSDVTNVNPIFDIRKNIICIDGGNNVVKGGQINAVMIDDLEHMNFSYKALDHYPKYTIKDDIIYSKPKNSFNMKFGKNEVELLTKDLDFYLVRPVNSENNLWVNQEFIYYNDGKYYCYDGSNNFLSLNKGDLISIIKSGNPYCLVKHDGIIGLIESKYIYED